MSFLKNAFRVRSPTRTKGQRCCVDKGWVTNTSSAQYHCGMGWLRSTHGKKPFVFLCFSAERLTQGACFKSRLLALFRLDHSGGTLTEINVIGRRRLGMRCMRSMLGNCQRGIFHVYAIENTLDMFPRGSMPPRPPLLRKGMRCQWSND